MALAERFWSKVTTPKHYNDCAEWNAAIDSPGYGAFKYENKKWNAHRFVMMILLGEEAIEGKDVMHSCDNRKCVNPFHLSIGTRKDNVQDAYSKGRLNSSITMMHKNRPRGEQFKRAKLTEKIVRKIRKDYSAGKKIIEIFEEIKDTGISKSGISKVINKKAWSWVK